MYLFTLKNTCLKFQVKLFTMMLYLVDTASRQRKLHQIPILTMKHQLIAFKFSHQKYLGMEECSNAQYSKYICCLFYSNEMLKCLLSTLSLMTFLITLNNFTHGAILGVLAITSFVVMSSFTDYILSQQKRILLVISGVELLEYECGSWGEDNICLNCESALVVHLSYVLSYTSKSSHPMKICGVSRVVWRGVSTMNTHLLTIVSSKIHHQCSLYKQ